ncbi:unnamed protein product [Symbiodinium microadriaticum]|nr:unnamed protein product [Symbiodinium microadriaticum]
MQTLPLGIFALDLRRGSSTFCLTKASLEIRLRYMDLSQTSLVTRVCDEDSSLLVASTQAKLLSDINKFLGIQKTAFEATFDQPGVTLCMLCIILWILGSIVGSCQKNRNLCVYRELRNIWLNLQAVLQLPRAQSTELHQGTFRSLSFWRFSIIVMAYMLRAALAIALLVGGTQWLGRTTSIVDLILNAVALNGILDIDEFLFEMAIRDEGVGDRRSSEDFSDGAHEDPVGDPKAFNFTMLLIMLLVPYLVLIVPLTQRMLEVKREMCFGIQNFVVAYNSDVGMAYGLMTNEKRFVNALTLAEEAVNEYKFKLDGPWTPVSDELPPAPNFMQLGLYPQQFEFGRIRKMAEEAAYWPVCWERDVDPYGPAENASALVSIAHSRMRAAAFNLGLGTNVTPTCAELRHTCYYPEARMVRLMCGQTCGCTDPLATPWYKQKAEGCAEMCLLQRESRMRALPCQDFPQAGAQESWNQFWDDYAQTVSAYYGQDRLEVGDMSAVSIMKAGGCPMLQAVPKDPITGEIWCLGGADIFGPLSYLCPEACGCRNVTSDSELALLCPSSCLS